jgi:hypothetical protein
LDTFFRRWENTLTQTFMVGMTICAMLQFAMASTMQPYKNNVSSVLHVLWLTVCTMAGSWIGFTEREAAIIMLPFAWLSAETVQLVLLRMGVQPREVDVSRGRLAQIGALLLFFVVYMRAFGVATNFIVLLMLCEAITLVYRWLYFRSK